MGSTPLDPNMYIPDDQAWHFARRFGMGGDRWLVEEIRRQGGPMVWFQNQLNDNVTDKLWDNISTVNWDYIKAGTQNLVNVYGGPSETYLAGRSIPAYITSQAIFTKKVVRASMAEFWRDVFNVYYQDDKLGNTLIDYVNTLEKLSLSSSYDVFTAVLSGHCMNRYLDNIYNNGAKPNENLAREIMELHGIGGSSLTGAYTEQDVKNFALLLSGWEVKFNSTGMWYLGFSPDNHYWGALSFSNGLSLPNNVKTAEANRAEINKFLLTMLKGNYSATYLMTRLAVRFVSDKPSNALIRTMVNVYQANNLEIKPVLLAMVRHPEFAASVGKKLKRPAEVLFGAMRAKNPVNLRRPVGWTPQTCWTLMQFQIVMLSRTGHKPFDWAPPTGYPDTMDAWKGTGTFVNELSYIPAVVQDISGWVDTTDSSKGKQISYYSPTELLLLTPKTNVYSAIDALWSTLTNVPLPQKSKNALAALWMNPWNMTSIPPSTTLLGTRCTDAQCSIILGRMSVFPENLVR